MTDHEMNADEAINRQRFAQVKSALRDGKHCEGVCRVHPLMTDAQILQLEASESILVDLRNLRVQLTALQTSVLAFMNRSNAVAGEQVEQKGIIDRIVEQLLDHPDLAHMRSGSGTVRWLCALGIAACLTVASYFIWGK